MIKSLYPQFQYWSSTGSVYIISDTHFEDKDCLLMDPEWITPQEHIDKIKKVVRKGDTLIHLGDVGNGEWLTQVPASRKILITGNHDVLSKVSQYFDEVYTGPLFIADRLLLSHEPVFGLEDFAWNIHGHCHGYLQQYDKHTNLAANVYGFEVFNLGNEIKKGLLSKTPNYHRLTVEKAIKDYDRWDQILFPTLKFNEPDRYGRIYKPMDPCKNCPKNPDNGGDGICFCTLGVSPIYASNVVCDLIKG